MTQTEITPFGTGQPILTLTDAAANVFSLFKTKAISANQTVELLSSPIVLQESEIIKATAGTGNRLKTPMKQPVVAAGKALQFLK